MPTIITPPVKYTNPIAPDELPNANPFIGRGGVRVVTTVFALSNKCVSSN